MNDIKNNEKNKSAVILNPERREWVSRSHVTSVEIVVNDGVKTKRYSAKRDLYGDFAYAQPLKMTGNSLSLSGASSEKQKESSLILRKAKFQAIFKFVLSSASGGAGGGKYNRISAFVSMPVLLIRRSLEFFRVPRKNRDDSSFCFGFARVLALALIFTFITTAESWAEVISCVNGKYADGTDCEKCGDNCNWSYDTASKKLIISAAQNTLEVRMNDYNCAGYKTCNKTSAKYRPWEQYISEIESVVIGDNIINIGRDAFQNALNLKTVSGMKDVTVLRNTAFSYNDSLTSFTVPASVISIGGSMFHGNKNLTELIIPDSLADNGVTLDDTMFGTSCFANYNRPDGCSTDTKIVCRGNVEKCKNALAKFDVNQNCTLTYCIDSNMIVAANESQCTGSNYYWSGTECARRNIDGSINCASGYAEYKNKCWDELPFAKKRWTPAEANQWLHDGNDNFVVITFKK